MNPGSSLARSGGQAFESEEQNEVQARRLEVLRLALAPIVPYLDDDNIIEIMLNADGVVWTDRVGDGMVRTDAVMSSTASLRMLELVANAMKTELSDKHPSLPAILPGWGARLQAMVPPITPAPVFTIRKPPKHIFTLADYVQKGILSEVQAGALREAVKSHANILVGGSTGAGKTTLVNAILDEIAGFSLGLVMIATNAAGGPVPAAVVVAKDPDRGGWTYADMADLSNRGTVADYLQRQEGLSRSAAMERISACLGPIRRDIPEAVQYRAHVGNRPLPFRKAAIDHERFVHQHREVLGDLARLGIRGETIVDSLGTRTVPA